MGELGMMVLFCTFISLLAALYFRKKRWKLVSAVYAAAFPIYLIFYVFSLTDPAITAFLEKVFGDYYVLLHSAIITPEEGEVTPYFALLLSSLLIFFIISALSTEEAVKKTFAQMRAFHKNIPPTVLKTTHTVFLAEENKQYLQFCSLLC